MSFVHITAKRETSREPYSSQEIRELIVSANLKPEETSGAIAFIPQGRTEVLPKIYLRQNDEFIVPSNLINDLNSPFGEEKIELWKTAIAAYDQLLKDKPQEPRVIIALKDNLDNQVEKAIQALAQEGRLHQIDL